MQDPEQGKDTKPKWNKAIRKSQPKDIKPKRNKGNYI